MDDWNRSRKKILDLYNISADHPIKTNRKGNKVRPASANPVLSSLRRSGSKNRPGTATARGNRPTSAPAVPRTTQMHISPAKREVHGASTLLHLSKEDKELIKNKLAEIEASRDSRLGKLDRIKRSNMKKKDRSFRQKRSDDLLAEGEKILRLEVKNPSPHGDSYLQASDCFSDAIYFESELPTAHASRAQCWKHLDRFILAYVDMSEAIRKHTAPVPASYFATRAGILLNLRRYNDALTDLDAAATINDANPHTFYNRAVLLAEHTTPLDLDRALHDLDHALALMEKLMRIKLKKSGLMDTAVLNESPVSFKILHMAGSTQEQSDAKFIFKLRLLRGDVRRRNGRYKDALEDLKEATSLDVNSSITWNTLGLCHYELHSALEAEKCFTNAVEIEGENPTYYFDRGNARLMIRENTEEGDLELGDNNILENAVADFKIAINLQTDLLEQEEEESSPNPNLLQKLRYEQMKFHDGLARAHLAFADTSHSALALEAVKTSLTTQPNNHKFLFTCGMAYLGLKEISDAFDHFTKALSISPKYCPALYQIALLYHLKKDLLQSYDNLTKCISYGSVDVKEEEVYFSRGLVLFDQRNLFAAEQDFNKALELGIKRVDVYFYRGEAKRCSGDCASALEDFAVVEKAGTNTSIIESAKYRYSRGIALSILGDLENGLRDLALAVEIDSHNTEYISAQADALAQLGRFQEAEQVLRHGVTVAAKAKAANMWSLLRKVRIDNVVERQYDRYLTSFGAQFQKNARDVLFLI